MGKEPFTIGSLEKGKSYSTFFLVSWTIFTTNTCARCPIASTVFAWALL